MDKSDIAFDLLPAKSIGVIMVSLLIIIGGQIAIYYLNSKWTKFGAKQPTTPNS